jgi:hypothetical protein
VADRSVAAPLAAPASAFSTERRLVSSSSMAQRLVELVGRVMIDPDFLADLQRSPETVLAQYELNDDERRTILGALARLAQTPVTKRAHEFRTALIRRVAT